MKLIETMRENRDFRRAYGRGRSFVHPTLCVYVNKNRLPYTRMGITAGKKVGNAVLRNRARRVIREGFRAVSADVRGGCDIVFVARAKTPSVKSTELAAVIRKSLTSLGAMKDVATR